MIHSVHILYCSLANRTTSLASSASSFCHTISSHCTYPIVRKSASDIVGIPTLVQRKFLQQGSGAHQDQILISGSIMTSWIAQHCHIIGLCSTFAVSKIGFYSNRVIFADTLLTYYVILPTGGEWWHPKSKLKGKNPSESMKILMKSILSSLHKLKISTVRIKGFCHSPVDFRAHSHACACIPAHIYPHSHMRRTCVGVWVYVYVYALMEERLKQD